MYTNVNVGCYGNTRSGVIGALTDLFVERMGQSEYIKVSSGGHSKWVETIFQRLGRTDVALPEFMVKVAGQIDPQYGERISAVRRSILTPERLLGAQLNLVVDEDLMRIHREDVPNAHLETMLGYIGHSRQPFGLNLDDSSERGSLHLIKFKDAGMTEDQIKAKLAGGEILYFAPFGGEYVIGPQEKKAGEVEVKQLVLLSRILAQKIVEGAYKARSLEVRS